MSNDLPPPIIAQAIARRLVPLRWPHSQKIAGYYDLDRDELVYRDHRGQILDSIDLKHLRHTVETKS